MKIAVCIKQVPTRDWQPRLAGAKTWIREDEATFEMNEPDQYALEEALRLKEAHGGEVVVCSAGPPRVAQVIREALARGADRAIHVEGELASADAFVVTVVGPAIAANSIASEREGRTWEAVLLTGLSPKDITRGKFLAAFTTICLYVVVLAPVGALSFLFGGVTATEVIVAFAFLVMLAGLCFPGRLVRELGVPVLNQWRTVILLGGLATIVGLSLSSRKRGLPPRQVAPQTAGAA